MTHDGIITGADLFYILERPRQIAEMPCSVTDGPHENPNEIWDNATPGIDDLDPDAWYDEQRQAEIDDLNHALADIARS